MYDNILFRNPGGQTSGGMVGWPRFTKNNRHILNIHGVDERSSTMKIKKDFRMDDYWEPFSITVDHIEQTCAFWNDFLPHIDQSDKVRCYNRKPNRKENNEKERKFRPVKIRQRLTTASTTIPPLTYSNIIKNPKSKNKELQKEGKPSSEEADSNVRRNSLLHLMSSKFLNKDKQSLSALPRQDEASITISYPQATTTITQTTTITTTKTTATTGEATAGTSISTTATTTSMLETTTTSEEITTPLDRRTTVTQKSPAKRRTTVRLNHYLSMFSNIANPAIKQNPEVKWRKSDSHLEDKIYTEEDKRENKLPKDKEKFTFATKHGYVGNNQLSFVTKEDTVETKKKNNTSLQQPNTDLEEVKSALMKQSVLFAEDVSYIPLNKIINSGAKGSEKEASNEVVDILDIVKMKKAPQPLLGSARPYLKFGGTGKDSMKVEFRMRVLDNLKEDSSIFPNSRKPLPSISNHKVEDNKYSIYKSKKQGDSPVFVTSELLHKEDDKGNNASWKQAQQPLQIINQQTKDAKTQNLDLVLQSVLQKEQSKTNATKDPLRSKSKSSDAQNLFHKYPPLPAVYDPFNSSTYLYPPIHPKNIVPTKAVDHEKKETAQINTNKRYIRLNYFGGSEKKGSTSNKRSRLPFVKKYNYYPI